MALARARLGEREVAYPNMDDPEEMKPYLFEGLYPSLREGLDDTILVVWENSGSGSSREHVVQGMNVRGGESRLFSGIPLNLTLREVVSCVSLATETGGVSLVVREIAERATFKVGELADRTGLSVRTLHYYDEIGLLSPSYRTGAGHRLYSAEDVLRLQQIRSLRSLGFGLEEVRALLESPALSPKRVIELHVSGLKEQIRARQRFLRRLEAVAERLGQAGEVSAGEFVDTAMEVIEMSESVERYYTPEQLEYLADRRRELGEERIRAVEEEWPRLMEAVRAEMEAGTDPRSERVRSLAKRWRELVEEFTGGDPGITRSLGNVWRQEEEIGGIDTRKMREMMEYVSKAMPAPGGDREQG